MRRRRIIAIVVVMGGVLTALTLLVAIVLTFLFSERIDQSILGPRVDWPAVSYSEVRGYVYNAGGENGIPIIQDGVLHPSVIDREGVKLSAAQVERLLDAVACPHSNPRIRAACYDPRHAFVFYDDSHQPVAHVEICFSCIGFSTLPTLSHSVGFVELGQLCKDLSLPVFFGRNANQQYLDLAAKFAHEPLSTEIVEPSAANKADR